MNSSIMKWLVGLACSALIVFVGLNLLDRYETWRDQQAAARLKHEQDIKDGLVTADDILLVCEDFEKAYIDFTSITIYDVARKQLKAEFLQKLKTTLRAFPKGRKPKDCVTKTKIPDLYYPMLEKIALEEN